MKYIWLVLFSLCVVSSVSAQTNSNSFNIRVFGGADTVPPSAPTLLSATPISPTQIDVSWSTSTDNFAIDGYVVSRGTSTIATTSLTTFSDTSVAASTTYSYTVRAFDLAGNYSTSSNSLSTTTPDYPPIIITPPVIGNVARIVTRDLQIDRGVSTTSVYVETPRPVRLSVRWGRSTDYELGYSVSEYHATVHKIALSDLEPGTTYEYEIFASTPFGLEAVIDSGTFTTLEAPEKAVVTNVRNFAAIDDRADVRLSWQLPQQENISHVRIVRSNFGFPQYPQNGAVVYQGQGSKFTDVGILSQYSPVYYTAFVYDLDGRVSSGAVALAYAQSSEGFSGQTVPRVEPPVKVDQATTTIDESRVTPDMRLPELGDIHVLQNELSFSLMEAPLQLAPDAPFTVRIPVETVSGNLKSIIGTVLDPTDNTRSYSFLLRINANKTFYEAVIPAVAVYGESVLEIQIYDYEAYTVATYATPLKFSASVAADEPVVFPDAFMQGSVQLWLWLLLLAVICLILLLIKRHRHEDKSDKPS